VDLLKRMLTYEPNQRISWQAFFKHRLFDQKTLGVQNNNYNPLGSTIQFANQMNNRFEGMRCGAPPPEYDEGNDDVNDLINQKGEGKMESIEIINEEENDVDDSYFEKMIQDEKNGRENDIFQEINSRYNFEREKIEFMRRVSCDVMN